jgi:hypothetical protein
MYWMRKFENYSVEIEEEFLIVDDIFVLNDIHKLLSNRE